MPPLNKITSLVMVLTVLVGLFAIACGSDEDDDAPAASTAPAPATQVPAVTAPAPATAVPVVEEMMGPSGSLTVAARINFESRYADPHQQVHGGYRTSLLNTFEGLTWRRPDNGELDALLAESWQLGSDGLSFTFPLRQGVTFWDGTEMKATDVKASFERAVDAENKQYTRDEMISGVGSVDVVDDYTVKFNLNKPYGGLLERLFLFAHIAPKAHIDKMGGDFWMEPIGTGPLRITDLQLAESMTFEAYADYWNPQYTSHVQTVTMQNIEDPTALLAALRSGVVDIISSVKGPMIKEIQDDPNTTIVKVGGASIMVLKYDYPVDTIIAGEFMPTDSAGNPDNAANIEKYGPMGDIKVRQAIAYAIDRQQVIDTLYGGFGEPWATASCRTSNGYNPALKPFPYDPDKAMSLLSEAGIGDDFKYVYNTTEAGKDLAEAIAGYLREVGIAPEVKVWDTATYRDKKLVDRENGFRGIREDPFGCIAMGESMAMYATWYSVNNKAQGMLSWPPLEDLIEKITSTLDNEERASFGRQAATYIYDNMGDSGLWTLDALFGVGPRVESYNPGPPNSQLVRLYTVVLADN
jgi:peptide/nickel transport system substrate-binding protein